MGRDNDAPAIDAPADLAAKRTAPTLRFNVADDVAVASVEVTVDSGWVSEPLEIEPGKWVVLIVQENMDYSPVDIVVTATDDAGNTSEQTIRLRAVAVAADDRATAGAGEEDA